MKNTTIMKREPVNTGRQIELDYAKALAIVFMIFVHFYLNCENIMNVADKGLTFWLDQIVADLGGAPAAPIFMFIMGVGIVYARRTTSSKLIRRAGMIFLIGLFVNIFCEWVYIYFLLEPGERFADYLPTILAVDIYSFVALMLVAFALIIRTKRPCLTAGIMTVVCLVLNELTYPNSFTTGSDWLDMLVGLFVRVNDYSFFPLVTWAVWPLLGFILGNVLIRTNNKTRFYSWMGVSGLAALGVSGFLMYVKPGNIINAITGFVVEDDGLYYAMDTVNILWSYGIVAVELFILHIVAKLAKDRIPRLMKFMSSAIMPIYVIQWMLIGLLTPVALAVTDIYVSLAICAAITVATVALAWVWGKLTAKKKNEAKLFDPTDANTKPIE